MSPGMEGLRDALADVRAPYIWDTDVRAADALLAPDGLLFPALRALGLMAIQRAASVGNDTRMVLKAFGITGPLADACLAAAEVEP